MPTENNNKTLLVPKGSTDIAELNEQQIKEFEALDHFFTRFYTFKYRHISEPALTKVIAWFVVYFLLCLAHTHYYLSLSLSDILLTTLLHMLTLILCIGLLSVFSRCLTRVFHFKINILRATQIGTLMGLYSEARPYLTALNSVSPHFEPLFALGYFLLAAGLFFWVVATYIPYKHLKLGSLIYTTSVVVLFSTGLAFQNIRNYVLESNEILFFSDFGASAAGSIDEIETAIDEITK